MAGVLNFLARDQVKYLPHVLTLAGPGISPSLRPRAGAQRSEPLPDQLPGASALRKLPGLGDGVPG